MGYSSDGDKGRSMERTLASRHPVILLATALPVLVALYWIGYFAFVPTPIRHAMERARSGEEVSAAFSSEIGSYVAVGYDFERAHEELTAFGFEFCAPGCKGGSLGYERRVPYAYFRVFGGGDVYSVTVKVSEDGRIISVRARSDLSRIVW